MFFSKSNLIELITKASRNNLLEHQHILRVIIYFEYFDHPVSKEEILKYCSVKTSISRIEKGLIELIDLGIITEDYGYYARVMFSDSLKRRKDFEHLNKNLLIMADRMVGLLKYIPFVRGIAISGSLSKKGARENSDIDYFIITSSKRVWFVKAIAILIKKVFFLNSRKYMCINYLLAEDLLILKKENMFQAIEAASIIPMYGHRQFERFFELNDWILSYFPNFKPNRNSVSAKRKGFVLLIERLFSHSIGNFLEDKARELFKRHGQKKYELKEYSKGYFKYSASESILFPNDFEASVLEYFHNTVDELSAVQMES